MIMASTALECTVIGVPDDKLGQKLVFVFEQDKIPGDLIVVENQPGEHAASSSTAKRYQFMWTISPE